MTDAAALPADLRRERIRDRLERRGYIRVADIARDFGVSGVTARGDLDALADSGSARRVHGGAVSATAAPEPPVEQSEQTDRASKRAIGERAASLVSPGQSVFLDVGSTALAVARALVERDDLHDVVVITNGLATALALEPAIPRLSVIVTGGSLRPLQHSLVNPMAQQLIAGVHADLAVLGCNGVDVASGVTNVNLPEAEIKRAMVAASDRVIITADASKLGRITVGHVASLDQIDAVVTDAAADADVVAELRRAGVRVDGV